MTQDCACKFYKKSDLGAVADLCPAHAAAADAFFSMHPWGGHEECCDLPYVERAADRHGVEAVRDGAHTIDSEHRREYALGLVDRIEPEVGR